MSEKKQSKLKSAIGIIIILSVLGIMLYVFLSPVVDGIVFTFNKSYIDLTGEKTVGIVSQYQTISHTEKGGNIRYSYIPEVTFNTSSGKTITVVSKLNQIDSQIIPIGNTVSIKYESSNPSKFIITDSKVMASSNFSSLSAGIYIGSFIILGLIMMRSKNKLNNIHKLKKYLVILGILIVSITLFLIYEYLNSPISISLIMGSFLFIVIEFLSISYFKSLLASYLKLKKER